MDAQQFCYWMQGFAELSGDNMPTPEQWKSIREHLQTVFVKVTPPIHINAQPTQPNSTQDIYRQFMEANRGTLLAPANPYGMPVIQC